MIKAIIFDCFGVLCGSSFKEIYRQAGGNLNTDMAFVDDILTAANSGMMSNQDMHQQVADKLGMPLAEWISFIQKREQPNEELLAYVADLKKTYKTGILSNANNGVLERKFTPEQLQLFDSVVISAAVGAMKPDPDIYMIAAERLGVQPEECLFTDDSQLYCSAAEAAGMQSIWYQNLDQFKADLAKKVDASQV